MTSSGGQAIRPDPSVLIEYDGLSSLGDLEAERIRFLDEQIDCDHRAQMN